MRQAIIFEDDGFFTLLEDPVDTARNAQPAAEVVIGVVGQHFAIPVNSLNDRPGRGHCVRLSYAICSWPIADDQQLGRFGPGYFSEDSSRCLRAIEYDECDRSS